MANIDFGALHRDDTFLQDMGSRVWLMDNHKWALWVWESHATATGIHQYTLAHADFHWDGGYDFFDSPEMEAQLLTADLEQLKAWIVEENWIRYDSFIAPAVVRGRFNCVHFFCKQGDEWDVGIGESVRQQSGTAEVLHETAESFASIELERPLIFDLCLDLFNKDNHQEYGSDLWTDAEVNDFMDTVKPLITAADLVTVSLSFGCSGTEADTRHLAALVIPKILAWRND